jgi:hypothetical protein
MALSNQTVLKTKAKTATPITTKTVQTLLSNGILKTSKQAAFTPSYQL